MLVATDDQTNSNPSITAANRGLESGQRAKSPATPQNPLDSDDCMDLPTYVSLIAEQSKTHTNIRSIQSPIPPENSNELSQGEAENMKEPTEKHAEVENSSTGSSDVRYNTVNPCDADSGKGEALLVLSSNHNPLTGFNNSSDESPAHHVTENTNDISARETENNDEESDIAMPLNHSVDDESEDVPLSLPTAYAHPVAPSFPGDVRKDINHRGGLVGSKIMKRSSSVISDSGIESEPSSVAWPLDAALRGPPPLDFSSEREIPQQIVCRHPVHRSSFEGLQMESNGSAGIQASLTSISSLPYEEDQQQRQLNKLTKSVSAPQISSPEDTEEDHGLLSHDADTKSLVQHQDASCNVNCSSLNSNLDLDRSESSLLDTSSVTNLGQILKESINSEKSNPSQYLSDAHRAKSVLSGVSEVLLLQESVESTHVKERTVTGSHGEYINHQTHIGGVSASVEDVHLVESEAVSCSCGNKPCVHKRAADQEIISSGDECQSLHQTELFGVDEQEVLDLSQTPPEPSGLQHTSNFSDGTTATTQRPSDLTGLTANDLTSVDLNATSFSEKALLDGQTKPSKIPNSGLAFMNKKMVEVVNMSVSCAPTCLPFSSALRDSPSISGMSVRQATSPITHQPLGSFGIISSSSLNPLNMDDETNERMLK